MLAYSQRKFELIRRLNDYEVTPIGGGAIIIVPRLTIEGAYKDAVEMSVNLPHTHGISITMAPELIIALGGALDITSIITNFVESLPAKLINVSTSIASNILSELRYFMAVPISSYLTVVSMVMSKVMNYPIYSLMMDYIAEQVIVNTDATLTNRTPVAFETVVTSTVNMVSRLSMDMHDIIFTLPDTLKMLMSVNTNTDIKNISAYKNLELDSSVLYNGSLNLRGMYALSEHDGTTLSSMDNSTLLTLGLYKK